MGLLDAGGEGGCFRGIHLLAAGGEGERRKKGEGFVESHGKMFRKLTGRRVLMVGLIPLVCMLSK